MSTKIKAFIFLGLLLTHSIGQATVCERSRGRAESSVVLSMDLSGSMNTQERSVQLQGYANSLRNPEVVNNLLECTCTEIAVIFWGSVPRIESTFKVMETREDIENLANIFTQMARDNSYGVGNVGETTELYSALNFSSEYIHENSTAMGQQSILISGDGYDSRLYPNLENLRSLRQNNYDTGVQVYGVPINLNNFFDVEQPRSSGIFSPLNQGGVNQTAMDYPEVSDFYEQEVITPDGFLSIAEDSQGLENALTEVLTRLTCNIIM